MGAWALAGIMLLCGCATHPRAVTSSPITPGKHWFGNRLSDFMDVFQAGVGASSQTESQSWMPPTYGVYAKATPLVNLGFITHNGGTAEIDGRGMGIYGESRTEYGFGPYLGWRINQGHEIANYYKDPDESAAWANRMSSDLGAQTSDFLLELLGRGTAVRNVPAKQLLHDDTQTNHALFGMPRGWQSWAEVGAEVGVPEPFILHHGVTARAGVDVSEVADLAFGFFGYDFNRDDRRNDE